MQEQDALALDPAVIEIVEHPPKRLSRVRGVERQPLLEEHPLDELVDAPVPDAVSAAGVRGLKVYVTGVALREVPPLPAKPRADGVIEDAERPLAVKVHPAATL